MTGQLLERAIACAPAPTGLVGAGSGWAWANAALLELVGAASLDDLDRALPPGRLLAKLDAAAPVSGGAAPSPRTIEIPHRRADGRPSWLEITAATVAVPEQDAIGVVLQVGDVTQRKIDAARRDAQLADERAARIAAERDAATDGLTGLLVRRQIDARAAELSSLAARTGEQLSCLFIDLDRFKQVNDTFGHAAGDAVLRELAARLRSVARDSDLVARRGGDEFVVLLPGTDRRGAVAFAHRVRAAIERSPFAVVPGPGGEQVEIPVTASIGVAEAPRWPGERGAHELYALADRALYAAKAKGGDAVAA